MVALATAFRGNTKNKSRGEAYITIYILKYIFIKNILMNQDSISNILNKSVKTGISGASAMGIQVSSLMWLRTTMNYQFKNGGTFPNTIKTLYSQGGITRFYRGYVPALMVGPLSRFGDTGMNELSKLVFNKYYPEAPIFLQTSVASAMAGMWRLTTTPIDTWKTSKQVHGKEGLNVIKNKIKIIGPTAMYQGAMAASLATFVGHYPWYLTFNYMNEYLPKYNYKDNTGKAILRNAVIGLTATSISDTISNSIRVVKTYKQTHDTPITYKQAINNIITKDGVRGLFLRGLETKLLTNGIQGAMFSVGWKYIMETFNK